MEKYHIYDEIGKGDFSQVFKGREKKQIEYVAIKRVDKSMMNKVRWLLCILIVILMSIWYIDCE